MKRIFNRNSSIRIILLTLFLAFVMPINTYAMHIMEGYLGVKYCIAWGIISLPFVILGIQKIKSIRKEKPKTLVLLAMSGAYIFVLSSLKIPSVTGSCSHMTGTGLAALLFGAFIPSVLGLIVLIFQAILLAHGGLTTLGANTFSMAIAGPIFSVLIYMIANKLKCNKKISIFLAAALGDLFTYCVTSFQLAMAYPSQAGGVLNSMMKFLSIFALTKIPLAIIEGMLTVIIIIGLESFAMPELEELGFVKDLKV